MLSRRRRRWEDLVDLEGLGRRQGMGTEIGLLWNRETQILMLSSPDWLRVSDILQALQTKEATADLPGYLGSTLPGVQFSGCHPSLGPF